MAWTRTEERGETIVRVEGVLDANTAPEIRSLIDTLVKERQPRIVFDLGGLRLIDSSGVSAIVSLLKRAADYGGTLSVIHLAGQPREIFRLLRLDRVFERDPAAGLQ
jgi:anti-sigma B factor antagonist